jgi:hypothetical protein
MKAFTQLELGPLKIAHSDALWHWATIESYLFYIFLAAVGADSRNKEALKAAFFAINGFEMRLKMTHQAAQIRWGGTPYLKRWNDLRDELDKQRSIRGKIVHRAGVAFSTKPPLVVLIDPIATRKNPAIGERSKECRNRYSHVESYSANWYELLLKMDYFIEDVRQR